MFKNPFFIYILTFMGGLGVYQLGWSSIMPPLSWDLDLFFILTSLAAVVLGLLISPVVDGISEHRVGLLPKYFGVFVVVTFAIEIAINGLPLLRVLHGENFFQMESSASHLHLFVFWSLYSTIRFADFLYSRRLMYLAEASLTVVLYGLMIYRGPALIILMSWVFIFVIWKGAIKFHHVAALLIAALAVFYVNGRLGDISSPGHEDLAGAPTERFQNLGVPKTYFWTYLYIAAPIGNLQLATDLQNIHEGTIPEFVLTEMVPDTFSRRILPLLNPQIKSGQGNLDTRDQLYSWQQHRIAWGMNVSTIFGRSYGYLGWTGPVIMFVVLSAFIGSYVFVARRSPYRVPALALLNTMIVFCIFNNMLASAAMIPSLLIVLLLPPWGWWPSVFKW
jgi:hypothetical protein